MLCFRYTNTIFTFTNETEKYNKSISHDAYILKTGQHASEQKLAG
jgi:hypothetical protein